MKPARARRELRRLILFLRAPLLGRVKTRLAVAIGPERALQVYGVLLQDTLARLRPLADQLLLYLDRPVEGLQQASAEPWNGLGAIRLQRGGDLGERMALAFQEVFAEGATAALLAGSDVPGLDARLARTFFRQLRTHAMVLGPALDGGYYLIGFRQESYRPQLFQGIPWSTEAVGRLTLESARRLGLDCWHGPSLRDIDTIEDLRALARRREA